MIREAACKGKPDPDRCWSGGTSASRLLKNAVFLQPARRYRATDIFDGCKPLKMGAIRKPRFLDGDVEKAMDGFFNNLLDIADQPNGEQLVVDPPEPAAK